MSQALGNNSDLGFTIILAHSRHIKTVTLSETEFADDIALLTDSIQEVQQLLSKVDTEAATSD